MKRFGKVLFVTVLSVLLFAGCKMKTNMEFEIKKEDMKLNLIVAFDDEFIDTMLTMKEDPNFMNSGDKSQVKQHTDAERWAFIESDDNGLDMDVNDEYTATKYDKDGFKGYVYTVPMGKLDDYSVAEGSTNKKYDLSELFDGEEIPSSAPLFIKNGETYTSNMTYKVDTDSTEEMDGYQDAFEVNIVFNLPNAASSNNAKTATNNNKTLTYDLIKGGDINFAFTYDESSADTPRSFLASFVEGDTAPTTGTNENKDTNNKTEDKNTDSKDNKLIYIGIGGVALVLIVIVVVALSGKKTAAPAPVQPVNPVAPAAPQAPVAPVAPAVPEAPATTESTQDTTNNQ